MLLKLMFQNHGQVLSFLYNLHQKFNLLDQAIRNVKFVGRAYLKVPVVTLSENFFCFIRDGSNF